MKYLLACLAAFLLAVALPAYTTNLPPYQAVRIVTDMEGRHWCSAVVLAPNVAITARHCIEAGVVDGYEVEQVITFVADVQKDIAVLIAPGLQCPCAELGQRPTVGEQVLAVGFPGVLEGDYRITEVGRVKFVGRLGDFAPWIDAAGDPIVEGQYIVTSPIISPGDSGGALFAMQDGEWRVVGIASLGLADPMSCTPYFGCTEHFADGFVPVDLVPLGLELR